MTTRKARPAVAVAPLPPDGVLLRIAVVHGHWAERLPPVPEGDTVTVSLSSATALDEHADALELLGYRVVGVQPAAADAGVAHFLLAQALVEAHPTFWRTLADQSQHAYSLAHGPVRARFSALLRAHLAAVARTAS